LLHQGFSSFSTTSSQPDHVELQKRLDTAVISGEGKSAPKSPLDNIVVVLLHKIESSGILDR
jgi:hypothetical protein